MRWRVDPFTVLLVLWAMFIVYGTLIPFVFTTDLGQIVAKLHRVGDMLDRPLSRADVVSNVLLFMPWGACSPSARRDGGRGSGPPFSARRSAEWP
jgi:hypothetical protein